jgi:hypothetical protein
MDVHGEFCYWHRLWSSDDIDRDSLLLLWSLRQLQLLPDQLGLYFY